MGWTTIRALSCWIILLNSIPVIALKFLPYGTASTGGTGPKSIALMVLMLILAIMALLNLAKRNRSKARRILETAIYPITAFISVVFYIDVAKRLYSDSDILILQVVSITSLLFITSLLILFCDVLRDAKVKDLPKSHDPQ